MSSIPQNKQELYQAIKRAYQNLRSEYAAIPQENARKIGIQGNVRDTEISPCDTIAYLLGWQKLVLKWYQRRSSGLPVDFPETGYKWNELGKLAQQFHAEYAEWTYPDLLAELDTSTQKVLDLVESLGERELYGEEWYRRYTLGRMIQFNTSSPMKNTRARVRKFVKRMDQEVRPGRRAPCLREHVGR